MLNIGSLILGACAWLFAGLAIATPKLILSEQITKKIARGLVYLSYSTYGAGKNRT